MTSVSELGGHTDEAARARGRLSRRKGSADPLKDPLKLLSFKLRFHFADFIVKPDRGCWSRMFENDSHVQGYLHKHQVCKGASVYGPCPSDLVLGGTWRSHAGFIKVYRWHANYPVVFLHEAIVLNTLMMRGSSPERNSCGKWWYFS